MRDWMEGGSEEEESFVFCLCWVGEMRLFG